MKIAMPHHGLKAMLTTLGLAAVAAACSDDFAPVTYVAAPRILALAADRPFARPGEDVALTLLASNPRGESLSWAFGTCTLPKSSTVPGCLEAMDGPLVRFDPSVDELSLRVPEDVLDGIPDAQRPSALIGVVVMACPGELQEGTTLNVPTRCLDADGRELPIDALEVGIKRVMLRQRDRNDNPRIEAITWDGEPWPEDETRRAKLCEADSYAIDDCAAALQHQIYVQIDAGEHGRDELGGSFSEQVIVQAYSTHGVFRDPVRIGQDADNRWVAQHRPGDDPALATLWFVARDDRGGVSWTSRHVELR